MSTAPIGIGRRVKQALAVVVIAAGAGVLVPATEATAAGPVARNGICESGEFCLYWGYDYTGSVSDFSGSTSVPNYGTTQPTCYDFKGAGAGKGQCVKNNAASVWNRSGRTVTVYTNSYYGSDAGKPQSFGAGKFGNLNGVVAVNNASHKVS